MKLQRNLFVASKHAYLTNDIDMIQNFSFGENIIYSDHKPIDISIDGKPIPSLKLVNECAQWKASKKTITMTTGDWSLWLN